MPKLAKIKFVEKLEKGPILVLCEKLSLSYAHDASDEENKKDD